LGTRSNGTQTEVTFSVKNQCATPTTHVAIAANSITRVSPTAPSTYVGTLGTHTVSYTDATTDPAYLNGYKFVPSVDTATAFSNGASETFRVTVNGFDPQTTTFLLLGHTADIWEPFTLKQDPACACSQGCTPTCPIGYSVQSNCVNCGNNNPGFKYWCDPTGSNDNPYRLIEVPTTTNPNTGFAPGTTDGSGYPLSCICKRTIIPCPNNCNGHGICNTANGQCTCDNGFPGPACLLPSNPDNCAGLNFCSGNGRCVNGTCACAGAYTGLACTDLPPAGCVDYSTCATCATAAGCTWCQTPGGAPSCTASAQCTSPVASCGATYINYTPPPCPDNCSGHGTCDGTKCTCDNGFKGINCGATDLTTAEKVGIGLSAGIVALIVILSIAFVALSIGGATAAYKYTRVSVDPGQGTGTNPLYTEDGKTGRNPLYA